MPISANTYTKQTADSKYSWVLNKISSANLPPDCSIDTELKDGDREIRYHLMRAGKRLTTLVVEHIPKQFDLQGQQEDIAQMETVNNSANKKVIDNWINEVKTYFKL